MENPLAVYYSRPWVGSKPISWANLQSRTLPLVMSGFYHSGFPQDTSDPTANSVEPSFDSSYDTGLIEDALPNAGHWINSTGHEQMEGPKSSPRRRRPSGDHVKHRRTRNGCYTCRSRRVKVQLLVPFFRDPPRSPKRAPIVR